MKLRIAKKAVLFAKSHRDVPKAFAVLNKHLHFQTREYQNYKSMLNNHIFFVLTERGWQFVVQEKGILISCKAGLSLHSDKYTPRIIKMVDLLDVPNIRKMGWRIDAEGNIDIGTPRYGSMWTWTEGEQYVKQV